MTSARAKISSLILAAIVAASWVAVAANAATTSRVASDELVAKIESEGSTRVIVKLRTENRMRSESRMNRWSVQRQRDDIAAVQGRVRDRLLGTAHTVHRQFATIPYIAVNLDVEGLARLESANDDVEMVFEDRLAKPTLANSVAHIEADLAIQSGLDGSGSVIVVADSGVDKTHPFLAGKVVEEACYAAVDSGVGGSCPNGQATQIGNGAGVPCTYTQDACRHGTHVAGIAVGVDSNFTGVAPGANLMAIQVFHASSNCGFFETSPCARAFESDITAALERVYEIRGQYNFASVNLSLGGGVSASACDAGSPQLAAAIDNLKSVGIATVIASGNDGSAAGISWPSCITNAISVGAVDGADSIASFSNVSPLLDLFAPGSSINSSIPGGAFAVFSGTSMATPHVAGAWAILQQANPLATVDDNLQHLQSTGRPVTDTRGASNVTQSRIRLGAVAGVVYPLPTLVSSSPDFVSAWGSGAALNISGADFVQSSAVFVDGAAVPTTYVSDTELVASLSAANLATSASTISVSVFSPPPGGGTSASITLNVVQPNLAVSATSVYPGDDITVTLTGGPGNYYDWFAFAAVSDPDTTYLQWMNVGPNPSVSWTVTAPSTPGDYEFRLFEDGGYSRITTSAVVTVLATAPPPPPPPPPDPDPPTLAVSATSVDGGATVTVTLSDGPGNNADWIALAMNGDADTTYSQWTYVGAGVTAMTWSVAMPSAAGDYEFRLFDNGGFSRLATSELVTVNAAPVDPPPDPPPANPPSLTIDSNTAEPGDSITVTLTDGPGNNLDWMALADVNDPDTVYYLWSYVTAGASSFSWTVNMPAIDGDYEFRLYEDAGYTRLATSQVITVATPPPPEPPPDPPPPTPPSLTASATTAAPGDTVTVTLADGPGNSLDWLAFADTASPDTTYLNWTYVSAGSSSATWSVTVPSTPGDYEFRLYENAGYTRLATSTTITVAAPPPDPEPEPPPPPSISVSATAVTTGSQLTATLADGPGNGYDWLALAGVGSGNASYLQWVYVNPGATTASWTINMPSTVGDYEIRLFENNGFTRLATSPTITVSP